MRTKAKLALATIGLSATVGAGIAGQAFAATTDHPTATASATTAGPSTTAGAGSTDHRAMGRRFGAEFAKDLAAQLGLPQQKVITAVKQVRTQLQADQKDGTATRGEFVTQLAAKLGLDQTKVRTAVQAVRAQERADRQAQLKTRLDQAVKAGKISQSDADAYLRVLQSGALHQATN
jgi:hypothetical protein